MSFILKLLGGTVGPYIAGGVAVMLALALGAAGVQSARLSHAKGDLAEARAALTDPKTHRTWQSEAEASARDLTTCQISLKDADDQMDRQSKLDAAQEALSAAALAKSTASVSASHKGQKKADANAAKLLTPAVGIDACARMMDVDRRVSETLK